MRAECARSPARLRRMTQLPAALADRNTLVRLSFFDQAKTVAHHDGFPNQGLCTGTCWRIPEVEVDSTVGTVSRVSDKLRVTSKDKMLVEQATSQRPLDTVQRDSLSGGIVLKERNINDFNV